MFDRRLRFLLAFSFLAGTIIIGRLFQLQIVQGDAFRRQADALLVRPPRALPPIRGRILDRNGRPLASDEPAVDACVHYGALSMNKRYIDALARRVRREPPFASRTLADAREEVMRRLRDMWSTLAEVCDAPPAELADRRDQICRRIETIRDHVWNAQKKAGIEAPRKSVRLMEESLFHPIVRDLPPENRIRLELELTDLPFLRLEPAVRRRTDAPPSMAHLIGRLGQVSPQQIESDPFEEDSRRRYLPGELAGTSGVERLAEDALRGTRGMELRDLDGNLLEQAQPMDGRDTRLTIDTDLQQTLYELLESAVKAHPPSTGAACVVIGLPSREILALVSYPAYEPVALATDFRKLRDDTRRRPLWPRALAIEYPPGSIIKPASLLVGLAGGRIRPDTHVECRGKLFSETEAWRCWTVWRHLDPHGTLDGIGAIQHSCNIFFYTLGQNVGAERLTRGLREMLYGPGATADDATWAGTGMAEEAAGLIPSPTRLGRSFRPADGRNYAIGQGELQITPLQAANLMATIACGDFLPPTLLQGDAPRTPQPFPNIRDEHWRIARTGLYKCVNEPGGTAHPQGQVAAVAVCGKTGSAQTVARIAARRYVFEVEPGRRRDAVAPTVEAARERLGLPADARPIEQPIVEKWPPNEPEKNAPPTHAWFAGYAPREDPKVAISVVIEYAGSGGKVAAPVGRRVFNAILRSRRGYLLPDGAYTGPLDFPDEQDADADATPDLDPDVTPSAAETE